MCGVWHLLLKALEIHNSSLDEAQPADLVEASKKFGGLKFGSIFWFCSDCKNMFQDSGCILNYFRISLDDKKILPDKIVEDKAVETNAEQSVVNETLTSLKRESEEMKGLLDNVMSRLDSLACPPVSASPKRKFPKLAVAWSRNDNDNPVMSMISDMNDDGVAIPPVIKTPMDYSNLFKMNISSTADNEGTSNLLKDLHGIKGDMPVFTGNRKYDGSVDVVFQNLEDATKAKNVLGTKLKNVNIKNPMPKNLKRFNLVGLQFDMNCNEVVDALIDENKHLFELQNSSGNVVAIKGDPTACIHVHQVSKCRRNGYRIVVSISANMMATLGKARLSVGYTKCKLYEWTYHKRCYNCNEIGHHSNSCENPSTCSKCSSKEHKSQDCTNNVDKCVNCVKNNMSDTGHPAYSSACPYNK